MQMRHINLDNPLGQGIGTSFAIARPYRTKNEEYY
jgi:hypothetical protein